MNGTPGWVWGNADSGLHPLQPTQPVPRGNCLWLLTCSVRLLGNDWHSQDATSSCRKQVAMCLARREGAARLASRSIPQGPVPPLQGVLFVANSVQG